MKLFVVNANCNSDKDSIYVAANNMIEAIDKWRKYTAQDLNGEVLESCPETISELSDLIY